MSKFLDLLGTSLTQFRIAIGGVLLKNNTGNLVVRNPGDTADAQITASQINNSGDQIVLNSDAANTGADFSVTVARPAAGMTAGWTLTLPTSAGTANQVLQTNGSGVTSWAAAGNTAACATVDTTTLAFGSGATVGMFTLPANAVVLSVRVIIDTAFNGTPSLSIGISGNASKYMSATQVDLTAAANTVFEAYPGRTSVGTTEAIQAAYTAGSATAGSARMEVEYAIPA